MCIRFANDGPLKVEKLAVDGFEQGKKRSTAGQFRVDGFFEDCEEFVKSSMKRLASSLGICGAKEVGEDSAQGGGEAGGAGLEYADTTEEGVDVCKGRGKRGEG